MGAVLLLVLAAFFEVAFLHKSFSTHLGQRGVNGGDPPPGHDPADNAEDRYRLDPAARAWASEPWAEATNRSLRLGQPPLWNQHQGAGTPLAANMQSAALDPAFAPVNLHPTPGTWDLAFLAMFVFGAGSMYVLLRLVALRPLPSVVGAACFILSGFFILYSNNMVFRPYMYLPGLVAAVECVARARRSRALVALPVLIALTIYAGFIPASAFVLGAGALFALFRCRWGPRARTPLGTLGVLALGGLMGAVLAAPLLLLFVEYVPIAHTIHVPDTELGLLTLPARSLLGWVVPLATGLPRAPFDGGALSDTRSWIGAGAMVLAAAGLTRRDARARHITVFFLVLSGVLLLKIYGFPPIQRIGRLPLGDRVQWVRYGIPIAGFGLAICAAAGADTLVRARFDRRHLAAGGTAVAALLGVLVALNAADISAGATGFVARQFVLAIAAAGAVLTATLLAPSRLAATIGSLAVIAELMLLVPRGIYDARAEPFVEPRWASAIRQGLVEEPGTRTFGFDSKLYPDTAAGLGMFDVRSVDALQVKRYTTYVRSFIEPEMTQRFAGTPYGAAPEARERTPALIHDNPMFDLLGVRYVLARPARRLGEQFVKVAEADGTAVYENRGRLPRAFLVSRVIPVADQDAARAEFAGASRFLPDGTQLVEDIDPRTTAVVEAADRDVLRGIAPADGVFRARITSYTPNRVVVEAQGRARSLLVLTDSFFPGWEARVNGARAAIMPADILFRGVVVPAGRSTIVFEYDPIGVGVGLAGAVFAAVSLIALTGLRLRDAAADRGVRSSAAPRYGPWCTRRPTLTAPTSWPTVQMAIRLKISPTDASIIPLGTTESVSSSSLVPLILDHGSPIRLANDRHSP